MKKALVLCSMLVMVWFMSVGNALSLPFNVDYTESGVGTFNNIHVFIVGGNETFLWSDFVNPAWVNTDDDKYVNASGPPTNSTSYTLRFSDMLEDFSMNLYSRNGDTFKNALTLNWLSQSWQYIPIDLSTAQTRFTADLTAYNATQTAPVPEPATMILFGTGLAGLAAFRRKKKIATAS